MANAMNDIVYWKKEYEKAQQAGKTKDSLNWISKQAQGAYGQVDQATAEQFKGMNASQAEAFYKSTKPPEATGTPASGSATASKGFTMEDFSAMLAGMSSSPSKVGTDFSQLNFTGDAATQKNMLDMMQEIYSTELPYQQATVKDQMANQLASQEQMGYGADGSMTLNMAKLMGYDNYGNATLDGSIAQDKSKLSWTQAEQDWLATQDKSGQEWAKIFGQDAKGNQTLDAQTAWAKLMGYDSKGNQTLDGKVAQDTSALKWADTYGFDANGNLTVSGIKANNDTITANTNKWYKEQQASQGWANVDIRQQVANNNAANDYNLMVIKRDTLNQRIANDAAKLGSTNARNGALDQATQIKALMNSSIKIMDQSLKVMEKKDQKTAEGKQAFEAYQKAKMQYDTAFASLDENFQIGVNAGVAKATAMVTPSNAQGTIGTSGKLGQNIKNVISPGYNKTADDKAKSMKLTQTSGVRSPAKNAEVGGSKKSDHLTGRAADYAGSPAQMEAYAQWAAKSGLYSKVIYGGRNLMTGNPDKNHDDHVHLSW